MWEEGWCGIVGEGNEVGVGGAALDGTDDKLTGARNILRIGHVVSSKTKQQEAKGPESLYELHTRPPEVSTRIRFFCLSVTSCPASVGRMSFGATCLRPGPSRSAFLGCEGIRLGSISSPGRTYTGSEVVMAAQVVQYCGWRPHSRLHGSFKSSLMADEWGVGR